MSRKKPLDLQELSDQDIIKSFYLSQGILFIIGCVGYFVFYNDMTPLTEWVKGSPLSIVFLGFGSGLILALAELMIDRVVPKSWFDDGGINVRVFQAFSRSHILIAILVVAFVEEGLFRGVIQTEFGLIIASLLFGFIHIRYIKKPLMLIVALGIGFYLGWLYLLTNSLLVPIAAHYTIDVVLGFVLKRSTDKNVDNL
jgi:uncharacterized protein